MVPPRLNTLKIAPRRRTPASVDVMLPWPPDRSVPPRTTAVMAFNSQPSPATGWPTPTRAARMTPARPESAPLVRRASSQPIAGGRRVDTGRSGGEDGGLLGRSMGHRRYHDHRDPRRP